jgi:hypothetical protein
MSAESSMKFGEIVLSFIMLLSLAPREHLSGGEQNKMMFHQDQQE